MGQGQGGAKGGLHGGDGGQQGGWQHLAFHPPRCWPWIWRVCVSHLKVLDAERGSAKIRIGATNDCLPGCLYVGCS